MNLYKGYVKTKDKKCTMPYKGKTSADLLTLEQAQDLPEFAGILDTETILIDVDDAEQSEILMKIIEEKQIDCRVYQTSRGRHFLFKNDGVDQCYTHVKCAIGLTVDVKVGCKNSYEVIKINGEERFIEWDVKEEGSEYQTLPKWLIPVRSKTDFYNMEEGDGRNSALFAYELTLQSAGLSQDEAKEAITIMNDYVLKQPLSQSELDVVLRDEAFAKPVFYQGKAFLHNVFGDYLKRQHYIKRINNTLHVYRDGYYITGYRFIENVMMQELPTLKSNQRTEVLKYLEVMTPDNETGLNDERYIAFRNGVYDIHSGELIPFNPEYIITNKIPWDYNPQAYDADVDLLLNRVSCNNQEIRDLLEEMTGYCFYRKNNLQKSFMLTGTSANGKSTFLDMLKMMLGDKNFSALDIAELDDRFSTTMMSGKLANIGDDIGNDFLQPKTLALFKKAVTGNTIKAENKGQDAYFFNPYTKLIFSANDKPRFSSKGFEAIKRRVMIIPFNAKFTKDSPDYDADIYKKVQTQQAMEYLILLGIKGLNRILSTHAFTESEEVKKEDEQFEIENNPLLGWLEAMKEDDDSDVVTEYLTRESVRTLYASYSTYCVDNGFKPVASNSFSKQLQSKFGLTCKRRTINKVKETMLCFL